MPAECVLKLYVAGQSPRSEQAIANLRHICEQALKGRCQLSIIDALEQPQLAEADKVLATPTLIKELPLPVRRVVGDLSDGDKILVALGLLPPPAVQS
jgi:circadian clock protein KaiB